MDISSLRKSALVLALTATLGMTATVTLPAYLGDNMVVQQQSTLKITGHSTRTGQVQVKASWSKQAYTASIGADGAFSVSIPTP